MIPLIKRFLHEFFLDEAAARRQFRSAMLVFSGSGLAFADQLAALVGAPSAVKAIKVAAIVCGFLAGATSVGEKNKPAGAP